MFPLPTYWLFICERTTTKSLNLGYKVLSDCAPYVSVILTPHLPSQPTQPCFLYARHFGLHKDPSTLPGSFTHPTSLFTLCFHTRFLPSLHCTNEIPFHTLRPYINAIPFFSHAHNLPILYSHSFSGLPGHVYILCYSLYHIYCNYFVYNNISPPGLWI